MADNEVKIIVKGDSESATKALQQVIDKMGQAKNQNKSTGLTLGDLKMGYLAIAAAAVKVVQALKGYVDEAAKQEQADIKMAVAMKNVGVFSKENYLALKDLSTEIQGMTVVGDDAAQELMTLGLNMGISADKIDEATKGAIGLNKAFGIDMAAAMKGVAMGMEGNFAQLSRYIPELRTATNQAEAMAIMQKKMADGYKLAQAETLTFSGGMKQMQNSLGEIKELIGFELIKVLKPLLDKFSAFIKEGQNLFIIGKIFKYIGMIIQAQVNNIVMLFNVIKLGLSTIIEPIRAIFKLVTDDGKITFQSIKDAGADVFNAIKDNAFDVGASAKDTFDICKNGVTDLFASAQQEQDAAYKDIENKTKAFTNNQITQRKKITAADQAEEKKKQKMLEESMAFRMKMSEAVVNATVDAASSEKATIKSVSAAIIESLAKALSESMAIRAIAALASGNFISAAAYTTAAVAIRAAGSKAGGAIRKMAEGGVIDEPVSGVGQRTGKRYLLGESGDEVVTPMNKAGNNMGSISIQSLVIYAQDVNDFKEQLGDLYRQSGSRQFRR